MSAFAAAPATRSYWPSQRGLTALAGAALSLSVAALASRLSPTMVPPIGLGMFTLLSTLGLAATWDKAELARLARVLGGAALAIAAAAASHVPADGLELAFGFASLGLLSGATYVLARQSRWGLRVPPRAAAAFGAVLLAALGLYNYYDVSVSRDLMIADFMFYRVVSIAVATLVDSGRWPALFVDLASSMKQDYSWAPALAPGLALALGAPLSRAVYQAAILLFYAAPATLALAWLARELARRARMTQTPTLATFALAVVAVFAAYPTGFVVAARGMPDIGGLALYVYALRLGDRLARTLALPSGQDRAVRRLTRRLALALALTFFAMFLFRRWYAFAAVGVAAGLTLELVKIALSRRGAFRWRDCVSAAALGAATLLALVSPVLVDWLPDPAAHDYSAIYAAYRKPTDVFVGLVGDWFGFATLALAAIGAVFILTRKQARLARLTAVAALVSAFLFLRVQTPYVHHTFLIVPAFTGFVAAPLLMLLAWARGAGVAALAALAAATLTPAGALAPKGVFPIAGQPRAPRADLDELARMKAWVDARATPDHKVCGLGSSYTFSGQLIDELWQLKADRSPLSGDPKLRRSVAMSDVDTVEGPPNPQIKDCAILIVGDPVQTHLIPAYQQTVIVPSREMLTGQGIGAHYRRMGEVFHLEKGVNAIAFEREAPLDDSDMAALAARWRAARTSP